MAQLYIVPAWFAGFDSALEVLFGLVTLAIAVYSYKLYKLSGQRELKLFSLAFVFLTLSYLLWPVLNLFEIIDLRLVVHFLTQREGYYLLLLLLYSHALLFVLGAATLVYLAFGFKNQRSYTLITSLSLVAVIFSSNPSVTFPFVSALLLLYVCHHYFQEYRKTKSKNRLLVLWAFTFIFLGTVQFVFAPFHHLPYVAGHVLTFTGYLLLFFTLIKTIKR